MIGLDVYKELLTFMLEATTDKTNARSIMMYASRAGAGQFVN